jgi:hypothetical protein
MGLRVGLLIGVLFALFKTVQSRRAATREHAPEPWQPIVDTPRPRPADGPVETRVETPVDEVGEPVIEPVVEAPTVAPDPATLRMPDVTPAPERVESEVAMVADEIVDPKPVAKPEPLDIVPDDDKPVAPVKKAAKATAKAATKATKKATKATAKAVKKAVKKAAPSAPSVEPVGGVCPATHPVKAKTASRLFHLPGMFAYDRTRPDRCYVDAAAAEADGYTRARR